MKILKLLILTISTVFLFGCTEKEQDIVFDDADFRYIGITADDYLLFRNDNDELEIMIDEENKLTASYERGEDIFLIIGEKDSYIIRKNGTIVVACSGEELICSGVEDLGFNEEIDVLFGVFEEETVNINMIVLGALIVTAAVSLFFIPKRFLNKLKIRNIKIGQLFILRLVTICMLIIGIIIIGSKVPSIRALKDLNILVPLFFHSC